MFRKLLIGTAAILIVVLVTGAGVYRMAFPTPRRFSQALHSIWLDQGWNWTERQMFYRTPQGPLIMPYSWFLSLERPEFGNHELFSAEDNLVRYGLVAGPDSEYNPNHLPIGFARQVIPGEYLDQMGCGAPPCPAGAPRHREWLSYTCAGCHTARLDYRGKSIGIDGTRGRWNLTAFNQTLANLLLETSVVPGMFDRFAGRVIRSEHRPDSPAERDRIRLELRDFLHSPNITGGLAGALKHTYPTEEGYGRVDAFGRGANAQFGRLDERNVVRSNAPVLVPPLWRVHDYDWVQTVAAIRQPLARNITQSWGLSSAVDLLSPEAPKRFRSTIPPEHMFWMETLVSVISAPRWPEAILGNIDRESAALGRYLFEERTFDNALDPAAEQWCPEPAPGPDGPAQPCPNPGRPRKGLCARCHAPVAEVYPNRFGKQHWQLPVYRLNVIGTDPLDASNFHARQVYTGPLRPLFNGRERVSLGEALQVTTSAVMTHEFAHHAIFPPDQAQVSGYRGNAFRAPLGYPARPLAGYWAAPPYLHNGSVPNLYELLSPVSERSKAFWTGDPEFDPINVGYRMNRFEGGFQFRTRRSLLDSVGYFFRELLAGRVEFTREIDGNSNLGHEFRDAPRGTKGVIGPYLSPRERRAIIEYMKLMADVAPPGGSLELAERRSVLNEMVKQHEGPAQVEVTARAH